ncbi:MAG: protein phosphatase 2C domain-containing protein, partial [Ruminococcus sp.]|nr:protein phosphatase 2C domain-containing protein [Ruminococcus sp.]
AVACRGFTFGFQIGDGSLVAVFDDGETSMLIDYEESNPANITSSICNSNAVSMFDSFYIENKRVLALYASTDGLYTSFGSDNDFLDYHTIITGQLTEAGMIESAVIKNLKKRSNFGTQDDISLSCIYDEDLINSRIDVIMKRIDENKQRRIAEKARLIDG